MGCESNHCCNGNSSMRSACIVELYVTDNNTYIYVVRQCLYGVCCRLQQNVVTCSCKVPDIASEFKQTWSFSTDLHKLPAPNFTEIRPVVAAMKHVDRRTGRQMDRTKVIGAFRDTANAPKVIFRSSSYS